LDLGDALCPTFLKGNHEYLSERQARPMGAVGGAIALAILGFTWGGWVTSFTATTMADEHATIELAKVLAPICFLQFNQQPGAEAKMVELKGIKSLYEQASFVEKSGAAKMPGSDKTIKGVSRACAELLTKVVD
jgi:alpha/beta superfamily hydrolase